MRYFAVVITFFLVIFMQVSVAEELADFKEGIDYKLIVPAQATDDPNRIEVVEVFWYGCPHCYHLEPTLGPWVENLADDVYFYRMPAIFSKQWEVGARAYFTADILGVLDATHSALFNAIHGERKKLTSEDSMARFYASQGVDKALFKKTYHSFVVNTKVSRAEDMVDRYGISGVPAIVIEGKYLVTAGMSKSYERMVGIANFLIAKERESKNKTLIKSKEVDG